MSTRSSTRRRAFWSLLIAWDATCIALSADAARKIALRHEPAADPEGEPAATADLASTSAGEIPWPHDPQYVLEETVGHRPRAHVERRFRMGPFGGERERLLRRHGAEGVITTDVTEVAKDCDDLFAMGPPRVLLLGDSHLMGVVANADNAAQLLEDRLRDGTELLCATVVNAAAGYYSLWQLVLRARTLAAPIGADAIVPVVFLGNDFIELEDVGRPHLDDALAERPTCADPPPETTSERRRWLERADDDLLFWQGLNQAAWFHQRPDRIAPVLAKAGRCLDALVELSHSSRADLQVALLPSYDMVFPDRAAALGPRVAEALGSAANARLRDGLKSLLAERGISAIDLQDEFRADGRDVLYALDGHIHVAGHRLLGEALARSLLPALRNRAARR
jgi:lysophospholipase L1-like esterase